MLIRDDIFLQSRPPLGMSLSTKKWPRVQVHTDMCVGTVRRAWAQIEETVKMEVKSFTDTGKIWTMYL